MDLQEPLDVYFPWVSTCTQPHPDRYDDPDDMLLDVPRVMWNHASQDVQWRQWAQTEMIPDHDGWGYASAEEDYRLKLEQLQECVAAVPCEFFGSHDIMHEDMFSSIGMAIFLHDPYNGL